MTQYDIAIIGKGVAGLTLTYKLKQRFPTLKLCVIAEEELFPPCSKASTGIICLSGIRKGVSYLGDLLYDSYQLTKEFIETMNPAGIEKGNYFCVTETAEQETKLKSRYTETLKKSEANVFSFKENLLCAHQEAFFVQPETYLDWLEQNSSFDEISAEVLKVTNNAIELNDKETICAKKIIVTGGAFHKLYEERFPDHEEMKFSKIVAGTYATWENIDLGPMSEVIAFGNHNLVYRAVDKKLLLGGTTTKSSKFEYDTEELECQYRDFKNLLATELPELESAKLKVGLRLKGRKRTAFMGKLDENIYALSGLYKNGWSVPNLLADRLIDELSF